VQFATKMITGPDDNNMHRDGYPWERQANRSAGTWEVMVRLLEQLLKLAGGPAAQPHVPAEVRAPRA
jgi:hypothetical protein